MKLLRILSRVVLPEPVPPEIRMLTRACDRAPMNCAISLDSDLSAISFDTCNGTVAKRRIDRMGPSIASGGMMALTREPSGRRASTMGLDSSMRRPIRETILSMIFIR